MKNGKTNSINDKTIKSIIYIACFGFLICVIMDAYLWIISGYLIPSWTISVMSSGMILCLLVIAKLLK